MITLWHALQLTAGRFIVLLLNDELAIVLGRVVYGPARVPYEN